MRWTPSEVELQRHFDSSCAHRHTGDCAESARRGDVVRWWREARVIWQVEELRSEQEILGFGHVELLAEIKIQADEVRRVLRGLSRISERACVGRSIDALPVVDARCRADGV